MSTFALKVAVDRIELRPKPLRLIVTRGPQWWRRFAERALRFAIGKLGAETQFEVTYREFKLATGDSLIRRLNMQQRDIQRLYDRQAEWLFCGPDAFYDALDEARRYYPMDLGFQDFRLGGHRGMQICGVHIVMLPWMDGYLLVPKLETLR